MKKNYKEKIENVIKNFIETKKIHPIKKEITQTKSGFIHIHLIAPEFSELSSKERDILLWSYLENELESEDIIRISVCVLLAPEEEAA